MGLLFTVTTFVTLTVSTSGEVTRTDALIRVPANTPGKTGAFIVMVRLSPEANVPSPQ